MTMRHFSQRTGPGAGDHRGFCAAYDARPQRFSPRPWSPGLAAAMWSMWFIRRWVNVCGRPASAIVERVDDRLRVIADHDCRVRRFRELGLGFYPGSPPEPCVSATSGEVPPCRDTCAIGAMTPGVTETSLV
jgi:hypothetical protein